MRGEICLFGDVGLLHREEFGSMRSYDIWLPLQFTGRAQLVLKRTTDTHRRGRGPKGAVLNGFLGPPRGSIAWNHDPHAAMFRSARPA